MSLSPRDALRRLVAALEHHLDLSENIDLVDEVVLNRAEELLSDAFFTYDDALFTAYEVELPFEIVDDRDDSDDDDDEEEFDIEVFEMDEED